MKENRTCRGCSKMCNDSSLLQLPGMPAFVQNLPVDARQALESNILLDVWQCSGCGLVQLSNDPAPYYKDVIRAATVSPSMLKRQRDEFKKFIEYFSLKGKNVLEIGAGGGEYLDILSQLPVEAYGMEHNPDLCKIAASKGLRVFEAYPPDLNGLPDGIAFDAFVAINFLEHIPNVAAFLSACANLLVPNGVGLIAVPDLEVELRENCLFSFVIDHLSYFSRDSLRNVLSVNGFDVIDVLNNERLNVVTAYIRKRGSCSFFAPEEKFFAFRKKINDYLDGILSHGKRIAVWGASHLAFSVIAAAHLQEKIAYIVDSAPFKQGRFSPASGLKIYPPHYLREEPVQAVLIMCPEYADEIIALLKREYSEIICSVAVFRRNELEVIW